jgi:predicted ATPase/class 3 adenylate cyclase
MASLPSGTVTFLFTDVEGSTRLWEEHPVAMRGALARHDAIVRNAIEANQGRIVKMTGDGAHAVFETASDAGAAALEAQIALQRAPWEETGPLVVRMGLHTGSAEERDGDYFGSVLNRAARVMSVAHGGQVLASDVTVQLLRGASLDVEILDLGEHHLRDLAAPMQIYQLSRVGLPDEFPPLRSVQVAAGNLPVVRSSFVGRTGELTQLGDLLKTRRLLTLIGVGGVGKTRLALQAAGDAVSNFPGGAWIIELARTGDPQAVAAVVAAALGAAPQPGRSDTDLVCEHLGTTDAVLVLDNCEHVLDAASDLLSAVLDCCPGVTVIATSREALGVEGEQLVPVRPLDPGTDAIALFAERARTVDPAFELTGVTEVAVAEICRRLDGVPLAVELAAARVDTMTVADIAARLDDRFRLLSSGRRRSIERHQTLRATLEWSHQLLSDDERELLRRLGVFASGFPGDAVTDVCAAGGDPVVVDEILASLVRKSLVQFERTPSPGRYRLLETVRAFALEQLAAAGEAEQTGRAHAEWIASIVDHPLAYWYTEDGIDLNTVRRELDNWRDAVDFALSTSDPALAKRLTVHSFGADVPETGRWTEAALALPGIEDVPGSYWLHWAALPRCASEMQIDEMDCHTAGFRSGCRHESELIWLGAFEALGAFSEGADPVAILDAYLQTPELDELELADLHLYRSLYLNMGTNCDVEAARAAAELGTRSRHIAAPVAKAILAGALAHTDWDAALAVLRDAEEHAIRIGNTFVVSSVASLGARALLTLPDQEIARELEDRFDRLQPVWNNAAATILTLCVLVLQRVDHPSAAKLHAFIWATPGAIYTALLVAPEVGEPDPSIGPPATLDEAIAVARDALQDLWVASPDSPS